MQFVAIVLIITALIAFVSVPLRGAARGSGEEQAAATAHDARLAELEAAREAKYREIHDADLDHRTGKLSDDDYGQLDATLRAEAVAILDALDRAGAARE